MKIINIFFLISIFFSCGRHQVSDHANILKGQQVVKIGSLWKNGQKVSVAFVNGTQEEKDAIVEAFRDWEQAINLTFLMNLNPTEDELKKSMIKIEMSYDKGNQNYSYIGTDALGFLNSTHCTMHFTFSDWVYPSARRRAALHEIGHALGLDHEHVHSQFPYQFKKEFLAKLPDSEKNNYILSDSERQAVREYQYDSESVMLYHFDSREIENIVPSAVPAQTTFSFFLSYGDLKTMMLNYPGKIDPSTFDTFYLKYKAESNLRIQQEMTHNDCRIFPPSKDSLALGWSDKYFTIVHTIHDKKTSEDEELAEYPNLESAIHGMYLDSNCQPAIPSK